MRRFTPSRDRLRTRLLRGLAERLVLVLLMRLAVLSRLRCLSEHAEHLDGTDPRQHGSGL